jgi:hypothetical protein
MKSSGGDGGPLSVGSPDQRHSFAYKAAAIPKQPLRVERLESQENLAFNQSTWRVRKDGNP